jgi:hypothetical protein
MGKNVKQKPVKLFYQLPKKMIFIFLHFATFMLLPVRGTAGYALLK